MDKGKRGTRLNLSRSSIEGDLAVHFWRQIMEKNNSEESVHSCDYCVYFGKDYEYRFCLIEFIDKILSKFKRSK